MDEGNILYLNDSVCITFKIRSVTKNSLSFDRPLAGEKMSGSQAYVTREELLT